MIFNTDNLDSVNEHVEKMVEAQFHNLISGELDPVRIA